MDKSPEVVDEKPDAPSTPGKPDKKKTSKSTPPSFEQMHTRLVQEMQRCAVEKDAAEKELGDQHVAMSAREKQLLKEIAAHRPHVERLVSDEGKLDQPTAKEALGYIHKLADLQKVRQARRLAFTHGGAIGDARSTEDEAGDE